MARPSNTVARRQEITRALATVMSAHGYEGASIPLIAAAAGLAPGLVHYHFKTKEEILVALAEELPNFLRARFESRAMEASTPHATLLAFLDAHVALGKDAQPALVRCWVIIGAESLRREAVANVYQAALKAQADALDLLVRETLRAQNRSSKNARMITAALQSAILGAYQLAASQSAPKGFAEKALHAMADGLIAAQPKA